MTRALRLSTLVVLALLAVVTPALAGGGGKPNEFAAATMATPDQQAALARKYWKGTGLKKIRAAGYQKVAIVEFSVEYVEVSKSDWTGGGFGLLDVAQAASGAGKRKLDIEESLKESLPRILHDQLRDQLVARGYVVSTLDEVTGSAAFASLKGSEEPDKAKQRSGGKYGSPSHTEKATVHPVDGLINIKMGAFAAMTNVERLAALGHDLGTDIVIRSHFRVGVIKGGRPTLEDGSWIWVGAGPTASGDRHSFSQFGQLDAKDGLVYDKDVTDERGHKGAKGTVMVVNSEAFQAALSEMFPAFSGMGVSLLDAEEAR